MAKSTDLAPSEADVTNEPGRPSGNASITRCIRAWQRAYNKELPNRSKGESDYEARKAANEAFLRAMPPLIGYINICDFIACITYAEIIDVIPFDDGAHLLAGAKLAITTLRYEPIPIDPDLSEGPPIN